MYESKRQALAHPRIFLKRVMYNLLITGIVITCSLLIGVLGYHFLGPCEWIDAFHNASMILSGMGPVIPIITDAGKIFSSFYALFSGLIFIANVGLLMAPLLHRIIHRMHLDEHSGESNKNAR